MELNILRKRFFDTAIADILRALNGRALVGAMTLSVCAIDYLAYLRLRHSPAHCNNRKNYEELVEDYLKLIEPKYDPEQLFAFRCALVHTHAKSKRMNDIGLKGYKLKHLNPTFHLSGQDDILRLNVESFITDIVWLAWHFFENPDQPQEEIEQRGNELLVVGISDSKADKPYRDMHEALRELDKDSPDRDSLLADIGDILKSDAEEAEEPDLLINVSSQASLTGTSGKLPS